MGPIRSLAILLAALICLSLPAQAKSDNHGWATIGGAQFSHTWPSATYRFKGLPNGTSLSAKFDDDTEAYTGSIGAAYMTRNGEIFFLTFDVDNFDAAATDGEAFFRDNPLRRDAFRFDITNDAAYNVTLYTANIGTIQPIIEDGPFVYSARVGIGAGDIESEVFGVDCDKVGFAAKASIGAGIALSPRVSVSVNGFVMGTTGGTCDLVNDERVRQSIGTSGVGIRLTALSFWH